MQLSVLTHNLHFHDAFADIKRLLSTYQPDIACFQEVETDEKGFAELEDIGYKLADYTNSFIRGTKVYCIATFYKEKNIVMRESESITLPRSFYEIFLFLMQGNHSPRTVLKSEFITPDSKIISLYNLHLSPHATNGLRAKQLVRTFEDLKLHDENHVIIAGDFNYPYGRKKFEELIHIYNLSEATNSIHFTFEKRFFGLFSVKLKDDYVLYKNVQLVETKKINETTSDHYPVLSIFTV